MNIETRIAELSRNLTPPLALGIKFRRGHAEIQAVINAARNRLAALIDHPEAATALQDLVDAEHALGAFRYSAAFTGIASAESIAESIEAAL